MKSNTSQSSKFKALKKKTRSFWTLWFDTQSPEQGQLPTPKCPQLIMTFLPLTTLSSQLSPSLKLTTTSRSTSTLLNKSITKTATQLYHSSPLKWLVLPNQAPLISSQTLKYCPWNNWKMSSTIFTNKRLSTTSSAESQNFLWKLWSSTCTHT